nr:uncharacterized protein LOC117691048 isoform X2 [Crassostrea gigas]
MDFKKMTLCVLMMQVNTEMSVRYEGPSVDCGHRLYFTNVTWYTAYKLCEEENRVLMIPDSDMFNLKYFLRRTIETRRSFLRENIGPNFRVWIGAFMRISSNESMDSRCKLINVDLHLDEQSQPQEDVLCLSFKYSTTEIHAESCDNIRSFVCYNPRLEKTNCTMTSNRTIINDSDEYVLCEDGTFVYLPHPPIYNLDKQLSKWCPELQEKIETRKKNLIVHRKETKKYQRTLISAPDDRPSSKYMGVTGALIISLVAGLIVCIDLMNFCKKLKPVRVKIE